MCDVNMARLHLAWVVVFAWNHPPTPDCVVHICALFGLCGTDEERPHIDEHGRYILYMGDGHAQFFDCT